MDFAEAAALAVSPPITPAPDALEPTGLVPGATLESLEVVLGPVVFSADDFPFSSSLAFTAFCFSKSFYFLCSVVSAAEDIVCLSFDGALSPPAALPSACVVSPFFSWLSEAVA